MTFPVAGTPGGRVLGISASLRNARFGRGSADLCADLTSLRSEADFHAYLTAQTRIRADDLLEAGRKADVPFSEVYQTLRQLGGDRGLSNSEGALAAGLWGAHRQGAEIAHCGLGSFFPANGRRRDLGSLREHVLGADAILLSGPVYFGDRGSLAQEFVEFLREDEACAAHIRDRLYGGIAVGAKRNGGQETTLIYQLVDLTNLNMLAVGNDSSTTSQYGGTAVAGDIGTLEGDGYGIETSMGTGQRIARVGQLLAVGRAVPVGRDVRIAIWLLQDNRSHRGRQLVTELARSIEERVPGVRFDVADLTDEHIYRCIACDVCPVKDGPPEEYRCVVSASQDFFKRRHAECVSPDAILLAAYSPRDRSDVSSVYQRFIERFIERTRYLRRDDYALADLLVAPLVISEVDSNQNLHIRMLTSLIRHHTVLHHALIGVEFEGRVLNGQTLLEQGVSFARNASVLTAGRIHAERAATDYVPLGYVISAEQKKRERESAARRLDDASAS
jgi:multimeric flavodoxin WrbA